MLLRSRPPPSSTQRKQGRQGAADTADTRKKARGRVSVLQRSPQRTAPTRGVEASHEGCAVDGQPRPLPHVDRPARAREDRHARLQHHETRHGVRKGAVGDAKRGRGANAVVAWSSGEGGEGRGERMRHSRVHLSACTGLRINSSEMGVQTSVSGPGGSRTFGSLSATTRFRCAPCYVDRGAISGRVAVVQLGGGDDRRRPINGENVAALGGAWKEQTQRTDTTDERPRARSNWAESADSAVR